MSTDVCATLEIASRPTAQERRATLTPSLTFLLFGLVCEYSIEGCYHFFQQPGVNAIDRKEGNFVTDYVPVPVRTLRNHSLAHVFWVSQPKLDTEFRDGMSSCLGIVFLRITFSFLQHVHRIMFVL